MMYKELQLAREEMGEAGRRWRSVYRDVMRHSYTRPKARRVADEMTMVISHLAVARQVAAETALVPLACHWRPLPKTLTLLQAVRYLRAAGWRDRPQELLPLQTGWEAGGFRVFDTREIVRLAARQPHPPVTLNDVRFHPLN